MKELGIARAKLLFSHPFFAYLLLGLEDVIAEDLPAAAATDGKNLYIKPSAFLAYSPQERVGVLAHEAYHLALGHPARRGNHTAMVQTPLGPFPLWSIACDYPVNQAVDGDGLILPTGVLRNKKYIGWTAEQVYADLLQNAQKQPQPSLSGMCCDKGWGEKDATGQARYDVEEWQEKIAAATAMGKVPGSLESYIDNLLHPKLNWREYLREFIQGAVKTDYRRSPANKHHLHRGLVMPSLYGEELRGGLAFDTSGSMSDEQMRECLSEALGIMQQFSSYTLSIWQADSSVQEYRELTPFDGSLPTKIKGRGGTSFVPVFKDILARGLELPFLVYFTDGEGEFPATPPSYPVLWVIVGGSQIKVPFGQQVQL